MEIESLIWENHDNFSKNDKMIAESLLQNRKKFIDYNISDLSKELNTSVASVVRFCKKLNLSGFAELKYILKSEEMNNREQHNDSQIIYDFAKEYHDNITSINQYLKEDYLKKISDYIDEAINVYVLGFGPNGLLAQAFSNNLVRLGINASTINDQHYMIMKSKLSKRKDFFIFITSTGDHYSITTSLQHCNNNHVKTLIITEKQNSIASDLATIELYAPQCQKGLFYPQSTFGLNYTTELLIRYLYTNNIEYQRNYMATYEEFENIRDKTNLYR